MATGEYDYDVEDVEYLHHRADSLLARLYRPKGPGPFPAIVEVHGGAWNANTRVKNIAIHEALARSGVVVAALDFHQAAEAPYPTSLSEVNYGIRWMKLHAQDFGSRPDWVGSLGSSSGGHQVLINAMKPADPKHASIALPAGSPKLDASVRCVATCWPIVDPLVSYQWLKKVKAENIKLDSSIYSPDAIPSWELYFGTEAVMAESAPLGLLERGEKVLMPPVLYIQTAKAPFAPPGTTERFAQAWRKSGGEIEMAKFEGTDYLFVTYFPRDPQSVRALARIVEFVHRHIH